MKQQKLLIVVVVLLVIVNLVSLSFLWWTQSKPTRVTHHKYPRQRAEVFLERKLNLSEEQAEAFRKARETHFSQTAQLVESIDENRRRLAQKQSFELSPTEIKTISTAIGTATAQLEEANFIHRQELREICNDKQKKKFDALMNRVIDRVPRPQKRRKRLREKRGD